MLLANHKNLDLIAKTVFLTDPGLIEVLGRNALNFPVFQDELKRRTSFVLQSEVPEIPEHQRLYIMDDLFPSSRFNYADVFIESFSSLSEKFFNWKNGELRWNSEQVLLWVDVICTKTATLPLMAYRAARAISKGYAGVDTIERVFSGPVIPLPEEPVLERLMDRGLVETHMHFSNSAQSSLIWHEVLVQSRSWISEFWNDSEQRNIWQLSLNTITPEDMHIYLNISIWLRDWLAYLSLNCNVDSTPAVTCLRDALRYRRFYGALPEPGLPLARHPGQLLPGGRGSSIPVCEGALWVHVFLRLLSDRDRGLAILLHFYSLFMSLIHRLSVHQDNVKGFDLFDIMSKSYLRNNLETELAGDRLIQLGRTGMLKGLEARIAGKNTPNEFLRQKLIPLIDPYSKLHDEKRRGVEYNLGVICHFIKRKDKRDSSTLGPRFLTGRHAELRESLICQAMSVLTVRDIYTGYGRFIVSIDGAGNELYTPPEVFAPVFRYVKELIEVNFKVQNSNCMSAINNKETPPLRFVYHVAEEFHHLLSGLRAIHEAVRFLDLPMGSRLGHCVALGFKPAWWLEISPEVRLPRLEWLDNLVWLYHRIYHMSAFRQYIYNEIMHYSREVYGSQCEPDILYQAWKLRVFGPNDSEENLPSQKDLREKYKRYHAAAEFLYERYHFYADVWNKGKEVITVYHDRQYIREWEEAFGVAQRFLIDKLLKKRIAIETCPLSNLKITQLRDLKDHPIFQWHPPDPDHVINKPYVLIATDNPGFLQSSLPLEYLAISKAAEEKYPHLDGRVIMEWLDKIREDTELFSFIADKP